MGFVSLLSCGKLVYTIMNTTLPAFEISTYLGLKRFVLPQKSSNRIHHASVSLQNVNLCTKKTECLNSPHGIYLLVEFAATKQRHKP